MIVGFGKEYLRVDSNSVQTAKKTVLNFLSIVKEKAEKYSVPSFYTTVLLAMYMISSDQLQSISPENLQSVLDRRE